MSKKSETARKASVKPVKRSAIRKATRAEFEKGAKKRSGDTRPTLESILDAADKAFTSLTRNYMALGEAYVQAITYYGSDGKRAFRTRFPFTDNALRNLEYVGRGRLLPQFAMCSDKFVGGLVNMEDSIKWQYKLLGASECGKLRIRVGDKIRDIPFEEFKSGTTDAVLSLVSKENASLTPEQLRKKLTELDHEVRANFLRNKIPPYEIRILDGKKVVRFMKAGTYTADELKKILSKLEG